MVPVLVIVALVMKLVPVESSMPAMFTAPPTIEVPTRSIVVPA